jgi:hypothetical protein
MRRHHSSRRHVVVVGRSPEKMRQALDVLESAGFAATGTFNRHEAIGRDHGTPQAVRGGRRGLRGPRGGGRATSCCRGQGRSGCAGEYRRQRPDPALHRPRAPPSGAAAIDGYVSRAAALRSTKRGRQRQARHRLVSDLRRADTRTLVLPFIRNRSAVNAAGVLQWDASPNFAVGACHRCTAGPDLLSSSRS